MDVVSGDDGCVCGGMGVGLGGEGVRLRIRETVRGLPHWRWDLLMDWLWEELCRRCFLMVGEVEVGWLVIGIGLVVVVVVGGMVEKGE